MPSLWVGLYTRTCFALFLSSFTSFAFDPLRGKLPRMNISVKIENPETGFEMECRNARVGPVDDSVEEFIKKGNCLVLNDGNIKELKVGVEGNQGFSVVNISFSIVHN